MRLWSPKKMFDDLDKLKQKVNINKDQLWIVEWKLNDFLKKENDIIDIIALNWNNPMMGPPDIYPIFKNTNPHEINIVIDKIHKSTNLNVKPLIVDSLHTSLIYSRLLESGYSIKNKEYMNKIIGFNPYIMFEYSLKNLNKLNKVNFVHALKGRKKNDGLINEVNAKIKGKSCVLVPEENAPQIRKFLNYWKVGFSEQKILVSDKD